LTRAVVYVVERRAMRASERTPTEPALEQ
jgi:hypothetical protein